MTIREIPNKGLIRERERGKGKPWKEQYLTGKNLGDKRIDKIELVSQREPNF